MKIIVYRRDSMRWWFCREFCCGCLNELLKANFHFFYYLIIIALEFLQFLVKISLVSRIRPGLRWDGGRARERPLRRVESLGAGIYILAITPPPLPREAETVDKNSKAWKNLEWGKTQKRKKRVKMEEKREIGVKKRKLSLFVSLFNIDGWP